MENSYKLTRRKKERSKKCVVELWERCHGNALRNLLRDTENSLRERYGESEERGGGNIKFQDLPAAYLITHMVRSMISLGHFHPHCR